MRSMAFVTADSLSITADAILTADGFIGWPVQLPAPLTDGYGGEPANQTLETDMEVGTPRVRRTSLAELDDLDVAWLFTDAQMAIFRNWWKTTAAGGAAWFLIDLPMGYGGVQQKEARFVGRWKHKLRQGLCWSVTGKLKVRG